MTAAAIEAVLTELNTQFPGLYDNTGYPWLEMDHVASIVLANNESLYPDKTEQVKFDTVNEIMYVRSGNYVDDVFVEDYVSSAINYGLIASIILVQPEHRKSAYKYGAQV
jgi:hypothetical protein